MAWPCTRILGACVVFFLSRLAIRPIWLPFSPLVTLIPEGLLVRMTQAQNCLPHSLDLLQEFVKSLEVLVRVLNLLSWKSAPKYINSYLIVCYVYIFYIMLWLLGSACRIRSNAYSSSSYQYILARCFIPLGNSPFL